MKVLCHRRDPHLQRDLALAGGLQRALGLQAPRALGLGLPLRAPRALLQPQRPRAQLLSFPRRLEEQVQS